MKTGCQFCKLYNQDAASSTGKRIKKNSYTPTVDYLIANGKVPVPR